MAAKKASKRTTSKKTATKKTATKKTAPKKTATKRAPTKKKAAAKKLSSTKKPSTKPSTKKPSTKKPTTKKLAATKAARTLQLSPFPELEWTKKHWSRWYGKANFPAWAGLRFYSKFMERKPKPHDGTVDIAVATDGDPPREPTAAQRETYAFLLENQQLLAERVLAKILAEYPDQKEAYEEAVDETWPKLPEVTTIDGLSVVIGPPTIHIYDEAPDLIGFAFDCAWDEEHQLGVQTRNGEVIEIGDGNVAGFIREH